MPQPGSAARFKRPFVRGNQQFSVLQPLGPRASRGPALLGHRGGAASPWSEPEAPGAAWPGRRQWGSTARGPPSALGAGSSPLTSVAVRKGLSVEDLGDLVELPLLGVLATYRADGTVLLSPVWHEYRDGGFNVCTSQGDIKARHLRRDPRAALVVAEPVPPYRGVEVTAEATFLWDGVEAAVERVAVRYLGEARGRRYAESAPDDIVVRLQPGHLRAWDFSDTPI